jgi:trehalose 6-phosphate phosphatase
MKKISGNSSELENALQSEKKFFERLGNKSIAVFLDYDGTLTAIASTPAEAKMDEGMREAVKGLNEYCKVGVISGRDLQNVKSMVKLDELVYAGSHGFDIEGPGIRMQHEKGKQCKPAFDKVERELQEKVGNIEGVEIERKLFAIAVHYRHVREDQIEELRSKVAQVLEPYEELKLAPGKMIFELKPKVDWHKGKALHWLMEKLNLGRDVVPVYFGDDMTDEDAFADLDENGIGILVGEHGDETYADFILKDQDEVKQFLEKLLVFLKRAVHARMEN